MNDRLPPDRRQFLTGKVAPPQPSGDDGDVTRDGTEPLVNVPKRSNEGPLMTWSANAMGCEFQVIATSRGQRGIVPSIHDGFELIAGLEKQLTTYDSNSELEHLNRNAARQPTRVSPNLFELLIHAKQLSEKTCGAFDVTAAPLTRLWNFHQREGSVPVADSISEVLEQVGIRHLRLNATNATAGFDIEHLRIDLGGIGKGYALDELTRLFVERGGVDFVIHGGQSSIVARGLRDKPGGDSTPWQIGLSHPLLPSRRLATITIHNEAVGTSGSGRQSFIRNGRRFGHIIDPRTGWPPDHRLSVTVIAPTAANADAMATALFVMSDDELEQWVDENPDVGVLILSQPEFENKLVAGVFNFGTRQIDWLVNDVTIRNRS